MREIRKKTFCKNCNKELPYTGIRYCSKQCKKEGILNQALEKNILKTCLNCSKEFKQTSSGQTYCSKQCASERAYIHPRLVYKSSDFSIFHRDKFKCIYCGKSSIEDNIKLHVDHLIPLCKGGKAEINNLITACQPCNTAKHDILLSPELIERIKAEITRRNGLLSNEQLKIIINEAAIQQKVDLNRIKTLQKNN